MTAFGLDITWKVGSSCSFCLFFAVVASLCPNPAVSLSF